MSSNVYGTTGIPQTSSGKKYAIYTTEHPTLETQFNSVAWSQGKAFPFPRRQRFDSHNISLCWNNYRQYYVGEYHFGDRHVITRSQDFVHALEACVSYFKTMAPGSSLVVYPHTQKDEEIVLAHAEKFAEHDYKNSPFHTTWQHKELGNVWHYHITCGIPCSILMEATSPEDLKTRIDKYFNRNRQSVQSHVQTYSDENHRAIERAMKEW